MDDPFGQRYNIGIDVGGTNTDGVLYDPVGKRILSLVKLPTGHFSYANSIEKSLAALIGNIGGKPGKIASLNISTTVSTNALLEGKGEQSNLILIGFDKYPHIISDIEGTISPLSVLKVSGGHTGWGKEREPLDLASVENFIKGRQGELFTVSAIYSPRNPAHETAVKKILLANGSGHVTCSHELSYSRLNSVKRTVTAYLNTSLVPLAGRLIDDIIYAAKKYGLSCPVMFLRSDSTLVPSDWCRMFPIEMIYSGPAASLKGARCISGEGPGGTFIVADIGGTSTDIGMMCEGRAVFSEEGAKIGTYRTMIPSLDIMSIALGGDSRVDICETGDIKIGPERSCPLCMSAKNLGLQQETVINDFLGDPVHAEKIRITEADRCSKPRMSGDGGNMSGPARWTRMGYSYTPTDAFNTMQLSDVGDPEISKAASCLRAQKAGGTGFDIAQGVSLKAHSILESSIKEYCAEWREVPRVYVGTPAKVFAELAVKSGAEIMVPEEFGVAGAVGAAASSIELACRVFIMHSFSEESFTAFLPKSTISSGDFPKLLEEAENAVKIYLGSLADKMGFSAVRIVIDKKFSYAGHEENLSTLLSLSMECRALVKDEQ